MLGIPSGIRQYLQILEILVTQLRPQLDPKLPTPAHIATNYVLSNASEGNRLSKPSKNNPPKGVIVAPDSPRYPDHKSFSINAHLERSSCTSSPPLEPNVASSK